MRIRDTAAIKSGETFGPTIFFVNCEDKNLPPEKLGLQTPRVIYRGEANLKPLIVSASTIAMSLSSPKIYAMVHKLASRLLLGCLFFISAVAEPYFETQLDSTKYFSELLEQEAIVPLVEGKAIERELLPGKTHLYSVDLNAGEFVEISVEQRGVDVVVMLFLEVRGDGVSLTEVDSPSGAEGAEPLYWIAEAQGKHVISLLHADPKAPAGRYSITLLGKRQPTGSDRERLKAQQAYLAARISTGKNTVESFTQAVAEYKTALELYRSLGERWRELIVAGRLGETLAGLQKNDEAIEFYKQALTLAQEHGHTAYLPFLQMRLGQGYEKSKLPDAQKSRLALGYFRQALDGSRALQDFESQAYLFGRIGAHEKALKMPVQAVESLTQAAALYEKINKKAEAAKQLDALASVLEATDGQKAVAAYRRAAELYKLAGESSNPDAETSTHAAAKIEAELEWRKVLTQWETLHKQVTGTITASQKKQIESFTGQFQTWLIKAQQEQSKISFGAEIYLHLGTAFSLLGEKTKAAVYFRQAARAFDDSGEYERADPLRQTSNPTLHDRPQLVTQYGHTDRVVKVALSADARFLASQGLDANIKIWDTENGLVVGTLKHEMDLAQRSSSTTDLLFVSEGDIWNVGSGELIRKLSFSGVSFDVGSTEFGFITGAKRFAAFRDISFNETPTIEIFDAHSGRFLFRLAGHEASVSVVAFSKNLLASGAVNGELKIWDLEKRKLLFDLETQAAKITKLTFSSDGKTLTSESEDKASKSFDVAEGKLLGSGKVENGNADSGCTMELPYILSPRGDVFARIEDIDEEMRTGKIVVRDANNCTVLTRLDYSMVEPGGEYGEIGNDKDNVAFAADGQTLASGTSKAIKLWNYRSGKLVRQLEGFTAKPSNVNFSPDGKYLHIRDAGYYQIFQGPNEGEKLDQADRLLSRLDLQSGSITSANTHRINEYLISPDFRFGLFHIPRLRVYQYKGLQTDRLVAQIPDKFSDIIFSRDGRRFLTYEHRGPAELRDIETARVIKRFNNFKTFGFSTDGKTLVGLSADEARGGFYLFDSDTGRPLGELKVDDENFDILPITGVSVTGIEITSDRKRFTVTESGASGKNGGASLYNAEARTDLGIVSGGSGYPHISFSNNNRFLAAENNEAEINLIDANTGQIQDVLLGHTTDLRALDFSADDRFLVSSSEDGTVHFWSTETSELAATLYMFEDGEWLVTTPAGFFDGTPGAWRRVYWRFQDEGASSKFALAPIEIFFNDFFRPGVLAEILAGNSPRSSVEIAQLDRRQPKVCVAVATNGSSDICRAQNEIQTVLDRTVEIAVEVQEAPDDLQKSQPAGGARDVRLFRGGSLVKHWKGDVFDKASGCDVSEAAPKKAICKTTVAITAGKNDFSAYAFNRHNVKSTDSAFVIKGADSLKKQGTLYILAVGVNKYADPTGINDLKYAVADVEKIGQQLAAHQISVKRYAKTEVITLTNENATRANILLGLKRLAAGVAIEELPDSVRAELGKISKSQPEDAILFHFSGHGTARCEIDIKANKKNCDRFYLLPHDGFENDYANAISDEDLETYFESIDAGKLLMVIDACNSGQALEAEEKRRGPMNSRGLAQLAYEKGIFILTASQSQQAALETNRLGHGLLTYSLLQGLQKADRSLSGDVIDRAWFNYAAIEVPKLQLDEMQKREAANAVSGSSKGPKIFFVNGDDRNLPPEKRGLQSPRIFYRREAETNPFVVARPRTPRPAR